MQNTPSPETIASDSPQPPVARKNIPAKIIGNSSLPPQAETRVNQPAPEQSTFDETLWPAWSPEVSFTGNSANAAVLVVRVPLTISSDRQVALRELLSTAELARADRYRFPEVGRRFIACRAALKTLLTLHAGGSGSTAEVRGVELVSTASGKPTWPGIPGDFSVSHSGEMALIAIGSRIASRDPQSLATGRLGIDLEHASRRTDCLRLARRYFAPAEVAALEAQPTEAIQRAFFRCWTRKEAYVKAIGVGLAYSLEAFEVPLGPLTPHCRRPALTAHAADPLELTRWQLLDTTPAPPYEAALFVESQAPPDITRATWDWERMA
jgi:4'-phosphopantetheinyl transferase